MVIKSLYYALYAFSRFGSFVREGDASFRRWKAMLIFSLVQASALGSAVGALAQLTRINLFHGPKWALLIILLGTLLVPGSLVNSQFDHYCSVFDALPVRKRLGYDVIVSVATAVIFVLTILMLFFYNGSH